MKATRKIVFYISLVLITGLMMIPCAVKQQIKSSVIPTSTNTSGRSFAKTCVAIYTSLQQEQKSVARTAPSFPVTASLTKFNTDYLQFVLPNHFAFFFKEKIPSYLLHCLFRI